MNNDKYEVLKLNNQFCFSLYSLSKEITRLYKPYLKELNLTYTQYITMLVLWEQDGLKVNEIGKKVQLDSGTLTPLLKKLESKGFIKRTRQKEDERNLNVTLTDTGWKLKEKAIKIPYQLVDKMNIPVKDLKNLRKELQCLNEVLSKLD